MPSSTVHRYTRAEIRANPDKLYVFGDNFKRTGYGGQAAAARGEPNAVGIVTKRAPSNAPGAFLNDTDYERWEQANSAAWRLIADALMENRAVVWPADGIGTGLARLQTAAPQIWAELQRRIGNLGGPTFA